MHNSQQVPFDIFSLTEKSASERMLWIAARLIEDGIAEQLMATDVQSVDSHYLDGSSEHPIELLARLSSNNHQQSFIAEQNITQQLCRQYQLDYGIEPRDDVLVVKPSLTSMYMRFWNMYLAGKNHSHVFVVASEPYTRYLWQPQVERIYGLPVHLSLQEPRLIKEQLDKTDSINEQAEDSSLTFDDADLDLTRVLNMVDTSSEQTIEKLNSWLLGNAFQLLASDIHLEQRRADVRVRFRIDGILSDYATLPKSTGVALLNRIKVLSGLDITESRMPQDGRISVSKEFGIQEVRVSSMPLITGEKLVMRIFDPSLLYQPLQQIFTDEQQYQLWLDLIGKSQGLILVTGPTGSGKTTTLYSTLAHLHSPRVNICTIENPVEMIDQRFNQVQVNNQIGMSFVRALENLLRQDPDIIMIGEIRDKETARIAVQAALTGHLVVATLHTNDALSAVHRMLDLAVPRFLLQATMKAVLAQRLVRLLCSECLAQATKNTCLNCRRTGYKGRRAVFELVAITDTIRDALAQENQAQMLTKMRQAGFGSLLQAGEQLVRQGLTDAEEVYRVCPSDTW